MAVSGIRITCPRRLLGAAIGRKPSSCIPLRLHFPPNCVLASAATLWEVSRGVIAVTQMFAIREGEGLKIYSVYEGPVWHVVSSSHVSPIGAWASQRWNLTASFRSTSRVLFISVPHSIAVLRVGLHHLELESGKEFDPILKRNDQTSVSQWPARPVCGRIQKCLRVLA